MPGARSDRFDNCLSEPIAAREKTAVDGLSQRGMATRTAQANVVGIDFQFHCNSWRGLYPTNAEDGREDHFLTGKPDLAKSEESGKNGGSGPGPLDSIADDDRRYAGGVFGRFGDQFAAIVT